MQAVLKHVPRGGQWMGNFLPELSATGSRPAIMRVHLSCPQPVVLQTVSHRRVARCHAGCQASNSFQRGNERMTHIEMFRLCAGSHMTSAWCCAQKTRW